MISVETKETVSLVLICLLSVAVIVLSYSKDYSCSDISSNCISIDGHSYCKDVK